MKIPKMFPILLSVGMCVCVFAALFLLAGDFNKAHRTAAAAANRTSSKAVTAEQERVAREVAACTNAGGIVIRYRWGDRLADCKFPPLPR
jgi:hypothetical protein